MLIAPERIVTRRLVGTRYTPADEADVLELNADVEVMRFIEAGGRNTEKVRGIFARLDAQWSLHGYGYWVLRTPAGEFAGGLVIIREQVSGDAEAGYALRPSFWGQGYASEAMTELVRVAFEVLRMPSLFARVVPENVASVKVLQKLGFVFEREGVDDKGVRLNFYRLRSTG
ncbi:MAG: GNAT family N-acetyltransferase [Myxococcaceae bacterium]